MSEGYTQRFSRQGWKQKRVRLRQSYRAVVSNVNSFGRHLRVISF